MALGNIIVIGILLMGGGTVAVIGKVIFFRFYVAACNFINKHLLIDYDVFVLGRKNKKAKAVINHMEKGRV